MTIQITTTRYRPDTALDDELADLGYQGMRGWADQRPVTATLVRSRLRPPSPTAPATSLVLARTPSGDLVGAAALRHPATPDATARLWGPVVAREWQQAGIGSRLLTHAQVLWTGNGMTVVTAEIPVNRAHGCELFERAGWARLHGAVLLKGPITRRDMSRLVVRPLDAEDATRLATLYQMINSTDGPQVAADTYRRWSSDERFVPDALLAVDGPDDSLAGVALGYPLIHTTAAEPPEVLVADVLVHPAADRATVASALITAVIDAGARHGAQVARAIVPIHNRPLIGDLRTAGLEPAEDIVYYQAPPAPALPRPEVTRATAR
ncbi:UNVERIFIED_ORG: GNAT superfamily N-acetyltransferase [Microbispora rosea subsp. rosea]